MKRTFIRQLAQAAYRASSGKSKRDIEAIAGQVVLFLSRRRLLKKFPEFLDELESVRLRDEKKAKAVITSKFPLGPSETKAIIKRMESIVGKEIEATLAIDPSILGGFKVRCDDVIFDATLDHSLLQLQTHLTTNAQ